MEAEFLSMMPHWIGYEPWAGEDSWGNKTYGAKVLYRGRVENKRRKVISLAGEEVLSETTLYLATTYSGINTQGRLTLPSGYLPVHPEIITVQRVDDEIGAHHTMVYA